MTENIKRLLFVEEPFHDESFAGYLLRLTELNYFDRLSWILETSNLLKIMKSSSLPSASSNDDLTVLSHLTGIDKELLFPLAYQITVFNKSNPRYLIFGRSLPAFLILQINSRICPKCLAEKNYLRRIWEFAPITVCLQHNCLLTDICSSCGSALAWNRKEVSRCLCKADLRRAASTDLPEKELRISKKIYQLLKSRDCGGDFNLGEHINNLDLLNFFETLFSFASAWAGFPDANGKKIFKNCTSLETHNYLNLAAIIFDDFPKDFYFFLDWAKYYDELDKFTLKQIYRFDKKLRL